MNTTAKAAGIAAVALAGYDTLVRPRILNWGATSAERRMQLPGDDIASGMPPDYTKAVTIQAPPEAVWPWLAQIGDHRAGFYSYDWVERFLFLGTVHYIEGRIRPPASTQNSSRCTWGTRSTPARSARSPSATR